MDKEVSLPEGIIDEVEGLFEVGTHFVGGDVEGADRFVIDVVLLGVSDT